MNEYYRKVELIAKAKYDLDEDLVESYSDIIDQCERNRFTPRRTVEYIFEMINS